MFIKANHNIAASDELCIEYKSSEVPYKVRVEIFSNWISPGVGFNCAYEHCSLLRSNPKLRGMDQEVNDAYKKAVRVLPSQNTTMGIAVTQVM